MRTQRLLERIASLEAGDGHGDATRAQILMASIQGHLQRILNTRQGSVPTDPDFGVPDFTNLAGSFSSGSTRDIVDNLTRMVRTYEPRLKNPRVSLEDAGNEVLSLSFSLEGTIEIDNREIPVRMATRISPSGKVSLLAQ